MTIYILLGIAAILGVAIFFYKIGYSSAKKNLLIHIFKEKMISPEEFKELSDEEI